MDKIRIAIVGVGNCASSLLQGIAHYDRRESSTATGLMHWQIDGYKPGDIRTVAAFDIDKRKVGKDLSSAIFEAPNCTKIFCERVPEAGVSVRMGRKLDGVSSHMTNYDEKYRFLPSDEPEATKEEALAYAACLAPRLQAVTMEPSPSDGTYQPEYSYPGHSRGQ